MKRFIAIQIDARMHYAVPALLARAGMLERFYTDITAESVPWDNPLRHVLHRYAPKGLKRLLGRELPEEIQRNRVRTIPVRALLSRVGICTIEREMVKAVLADGSGVANGLYTVTTADYPVVQEAKARGLFVAHEQFISPDYPAIMQEEHKLFPGVELGNDPDLADTFYDQHTRQWNAADCVVVPSRYVADACVRRGVPANKIALVPYGVNTAWLNLPRRPVAGRVLFVGSVGLRKGNHYLAAAARLLLERRVPCDIRVVGPVRRHILDSRLFAGPKYIGQVPRKQIREEYAAASLFVIPSLCEGSVTAHLEALAAGLPVITTHNAGTVIRDGVDGFIVPVRDSEALASRIELLLSDPDLRERMSVAARQRSLDFTWEHYGNRLIGALSVGHTSLKHHQ